MSKTKYVLHIPPLWEDKKRKLKTHRPFSDSIETKPLVVEKTGLDDSGLHKIFDDNENILNVALLPIAHCSLNIEDLGLEILGPSISTRNDIFVFRKSGPVTEKGSQRSYRIGVKEVEITTTNALRVALARWPIDQLLNLSEPYVYDRFPAIKEAHESLREIFRANLFSCHGEYDEKARLRKLKSGEFDAAVFMGKEIAPAGRSLFNDSELIDALNLNREMSRRYNIGYMPRAVLCIRSTTGFWDLRHKQEFCAIYNETLHSMKTLTVTKGRKLPWRFQKLTPTGPLAEPTDIDALIKFTKDMREDKVVEAWRIKDAGDLELEKEIESSRAIKTTDFTFWPMHFEADFANALAEELGVCLDRIALSLGATSKSKGTERFERAKSSMLDLICPQTFLEAGNELDAHLARIAADNDIITDREMFSGLSIAVKDAVGAVEASPL